MTRFVEEIQSRHRTIGSGLERLLFKADRLSLLAEFYHAVTLGIFNSIGEDGGAMAASNSGLYQLGQPRTEEHVVAQDQGDTLMRPMNSAPITKACAKPSGRGCSAYLMTRPRLRIY
jgi:hypothetical protein